MHATLPPHPTSLSSFSLVIYMCNVVIGLESKHDTHAMVVHSNCRARLWWDCQPPTAEVGCRGSHVLSKPDGYLSLLNPAAPAAASCTQTGVLQGCCAAEVPLAFLALPPPSCWLSALLYLAKALAAASAEEMKAAARRCGGASLLEETSAGSSCACAEEGPSSSALVRRPDPPPSIQDTAAMHRATSRQVRLCLKVMLGVVHAGK